MRLHNWSAELGFSKVSRIIVLDLGKCSMAAPHLRSVFVSIALSSHRGLQVTRVYYFCFMRGSLQAFTPPSLNCTGSLRSKYPQNIALLGFSRCSLSVVCVYCFFLLSRAVVVKCSRSLELSISCYPPWRISISLAVWYCRRENRME